MIRLTSLLLHCLQSLDQFWLTLETVCMLLPGYSFNFIVVILYLFITVHYFIYLYQYLLAHSYHIAWFYEDHISALYFKTFLTLHFCNIFCNYLVVPYI